MKVCFEVKGAGLFAALDAGGGGSAARTALARGGGAARDFRLDPVHALYPSSRSYARATHTLYDILLSLSLPLPIHSLHTQLSTADRRDRAEFPSQRLIQTRQLCEKQRV